VPRDAAISANILPGDVTGVQTAARSRCLPASFTSYCNFRFRRARPMPSGPSLIYQIATDCLREFSLGENVRATTWRGNPMYPSREQISQQTPDHLWEGLK